MEVTTTAVYGPRHDIFLFGAALQWTDGAVGGDVGGGLRLPLRTSCSVLRERLYRHSLPHSFMVFSDRNWVVVPPSRDVAEIEDVDLSDVEGEREEEENEGGDEEEGEETAFPGRTAS